MDLGIQGKVALITGGSIGIAGATARLLAKEGVSLAITARHEKQLIETANAISGETAAEVIPLTQTVLIDDVGNAVAEVINHHGRIHILVNSISSAAAGRFPRTHRRGMAQELSSIRAP